MLSGPVVRLTHNNNLRQICKYKFSFGKLAVQQAKRAEIYGSGRQQAERSPDFSQSIAEIASREGVTMIINHQKAKAISQIILLAMCTTIMLNARAQTQSAESGETDEGAIEEIIVTATKRAMNIQDVPMAITAIGGDYLESTGASDLSDIVLRTPGLSFSQNDRSNMRIALRGLSSLVRTSSDFPVVSSYIDDVPISESSIPDVGLLDLARVEVLRGPQGTLYGEGAMGGTVRFVTNKPNTQEFEGNIAPEFSSTSEGTTNSRVSGVANFVLSEDAAALRIAGFYEDYGGYVDNVAPGNEEENADAFERYGVRASLLWEPTDLLSLTLTGMYQEYSGGLQPVVFPEVVPGLTPRLFPPELAGETSGFRQALTEADDELTVINGVIAYDLDFATFTSSTSYYRRDRDHANDETNTSAVIEAALTPLTTNPGLQPFFDAFGVAGPFVVNNGTQVFADEGNRTFAQELRLVSTADNRLQWTVGAYYRDREVFSNVEVFSPDIIPVNQALVAASDFLGVPLTGDPDFAGRIQGSTANIQYRQYAVFGEAEYALSDRWSILGGLRYLDEEVEATNSISAIIADAPGPDFFTVPTVVFDTEPVSESNLLYKLGLSFFASDDALLYGQIANGIRPGGLNERANALDPNSPLSFDSDSLVSYEIGAKTTWFDRALTVNAATYFTDWKDIQFADARDPQFPVTRNAARSEVKGLELELAGYPGESLQTGLVISLMDAEFSENSLPIGTPPDQVYLVADGQPLPIAPDVTIGAFGEWTYPISDASDFLAYAEVVYVGEREANTAREETAPRPGTYGTLDSYTEMNLQLGLDYERYTVTVFANNLLDEYAHLGGRIITGYSRNAPRTVGVRFRADF